MSGQARGRTWDEFQVGELHTTAGRTVTESDVVAFAGLSGDFNPLHTDAEFARRSPFGERIAHGALILAMTTGLANQLGIFEGTTIALLQMTTKYTGAVRFGDTVRAELKVAEKKETKKADRGVATFDVTVKNQKDEAVLEGQWVLLLQRKR